MVLLVHLSGTLYSQDKVLLRFNPKEGLSFVTEYDMNTTIDQEVMGIDQQVRMNMVMETETETLESSGGEHPMLFSYKRLSIETVTPINTIVIDTDSDEDQPGIEYLKLMTGKKFTVVANDKGKVTGVEGLDEIMKEITDAVSKDNPAAQSYKNTLADAFGAENIRNNFELITPEYPDHPVGVGDSWTYELVTSTAQFKFKLVNLCIVKDITKDKVLLQISSDIHNMLDSEIVIEGMKAKMNMKGKQVSELNILRETGLPENGVINQEIKGEMTINMTEQGMENLKVPMDISTRIRVTVNFE